MGEKVSGKNFRGEWEIEAVVNNIDAELGIRIQKVAIALRNRIISNIAIPVTRDGNTVVTRSKPGEFPRKDKGKLTKEIVFQVNTPRENVWEGSVGTRTDYGPALELKMDRSFLLRTLMEQIPFIVNILTRPMKGF